MTHSPPAGRTSPTQSPRQYAPIGPDQRPTAFSPWPRFGNIGLFACSLTASTQTAPSSDAPIDGEPDTVIRSPPEARLRIANVKPGQFRIRAAVPIAGSEE